MKAPLIPVNETERMNALRESGLLEIDNYPAFDRLTRLATRFFRVPLAMITLVDDHAAIVKSADGRALASQPRDLSFCGIRSWVTRRWWWLTRCWTNALRIIRRWREIRACAFMPVSRCVYVTGRA